MTETEKLKAMTGESDESILSLLLSDAEDFVLGYTSRAKLPKGLDKTVRDLAVIAYNRRGTEGESGRSEGGESYTFDSAPKHIYDVLNRYRLARIGGKAYENQTEPAERISPPACELKEG